MWKMVVGLITYVLLLYGCSYGVGDDFLPQEEAVPIRMAIEEGNLPTRAPVITIDASNLSSVGVYGVRESSTVGQFPWTATPFASNLAPSTISGNQISFSPVIYYPLGGKRVTFYGYYPRTTATSGANYMTPPSAGVAPVYNFTLTGAEDVMYAVSAPSSSINPSAALTFNHKLIQLQLNISLLGALSSIKLVGVPNQGALNLGTGNVTYNSSVADIPLTVPLLSSTTTPVMVPAGTASFKVEVVLLLSLLKSTYLIKPTTATFQPGIIYTITL